jgi:hypothetical protein
LFPFIIDVSPIESNSNNSQRYFTEIRKSIRENTTSLHVRYSTKFVIFYNKQYNVNMQLAAKSQPYKSPDSALIEEPTSGLIQVKNEN